MEISRAKRIILRMISKNIFHSHFPVVKGTLMWNDIALIMKYIDLTHTLKQSMPVYPGDPKPELRQIATIAKNGYNDHQITIGMHVGTHIDAPFHMLASGKKISDFPAAAFFGRGTVVDARGQQQIDANLLSNIDIQPDDIVLACTGFDKRYRQKDYFEKYPELTESFAKELISRGIKMIGIDSPSPDRPPFMIHKLLLQEDILIIENLTNLDALLTHKSFDVVGLPLKLDTDAAPARVIARVV